MVGLGQVPTRSELRFNHYTDAIYAAINGEGVILGWERLIADLLREGRLVRLADQVATPPEGYHILRPGGGRPTPATRLFADWLIGEFGRSVA
jgi:DNA-binding transcriptional LysR family regulator